MMSIEDQLSWLWKYNAVVEFGNAWVSITSASIRVYEPAFKVVPMALSAGGFSLLDAIVAADAEIKEIVRRHNLRYKAA